MSGRKISTCSIASKVIADNPVCQTRKLADARNFTALRGKAGRIWTRFDPMKLATAEAFVLEYHSALPGWFMRACDHGGLPAVAPEERTLLVNGANSTGKEGVTGEYILSYQDCRECHGANLTGDVEGRPAAMNSANKCHGVQFSIPCYGLTRPCQYHYLTRHNANYGRQMTTLPAYPPTPGTITKALFKCWELIFKGAPAIPVYTNAGAPTNGIGFLNSARHGSCPVKKDFSLPSHLLDWVLVVQILGVVDAGVKFCFALGRCDYDNPIANQLLQGVGFEEDEAR